MMDHGTRKEVKEKPKRTRKTQKSAKEKPYVEQINELLFVHNKEDPKAGVQAVSEIDGEGKVRTGSCRRKERKLLSEIQRKTPVSSKTSSGTSGASSRNLHISGSYE